MVMLLQVLLGCAVAGVASASTFVPLPVKSSKSTGSFFPNGYIVTFRSSSSSPGSVQARSAVSPHQRFQQRMDAKKVKYKTLSSYDNDDIFVGAAVQLYDSSDLAKLSSMPDVESVSPIRTYTVPKPLQRVTFGNVKNSAATELVAAVHKSTGVDVLQKGGNYGRGVAVAIIDTGVDYTHPALGGCFGPGCKVSKGYDFVGDAYNGVTNFNKKPDPNPYAGSNCSTHGTVTSGVVGANSTSPAPVFLGAAPQAEIYMYRIFGCDTVETESSADDASIISALIRAYTDGANVINLSLGDTRGWSESQTSVIAQKIAARGVVVVVAQGNSGNEGALYASDPSSGKGVISVGSTDGTYNGISFNGRVTGGSKNGQAFSDFTFTYNALDMLFISNFPIYALSTDTSAKNTGDACSALPDSTPDLSGYIVVAKRGTCFFPEKYANIAAKGGLFLIIYGQETQPDPDLLPSVGEAPASGLRQVGYVLHDVGVQLVARSQTGARLSADTSNFTLQRNPTAGLVSAFSSYGPNFELDTPSPALVAPGGNIVSLIPGRRFGIESGTSLSAPLVAGAAALYLSAKGLSTENAFALPSLLTTTAEPVKDSTGNFLDSVIHQGAGVLAIDTATTTTLAAEPGFLLLNDTQHLNAVQTVTVKNTGKSTVNLAISHVDSGTLLSFPLNSPIQNTFPARLKPAPAAVKFSHAKLSLAPGASANLTVTFTPPRMANKRQAPFYSGFIKIGSVSVPYYGLASALYDVPVIDASSRAYDLQLPALLGANSDVVPSKGSTTISMKAGQRVMFYYRLVVGTRLLRADIVSDSYSLSGSSSSSSSNSKRAVGFGSVRAVDSLDGVPLHVLPATTPNVTESDSTLFKRAANSPLAADVPSFGLVAYDQFTARSTSNPPGEPFITYFDGKVTTTDFKQNIVLPPGRYRILLRALRLTGNITLEQDFNTWLSPTVVLEE